MRLREDLKYAWTLWRWKRRARQRRRQRIRIGNLPSFFAALNAASVPYVVLRWFDEVPLTRAAESAFVGDLDVLVAADHIEALCRAVSAHPGPVKVDLYSNGVRFGTGYQRMPYYPPVLADEILASRVLHDGVFFRPSPELYLKSLIYHLVYHKGLRCGLPSGAELAAGPPPRHSIRQTLAALGREAGAALPAEPTLLSLHDWLKSVNWDMPFDLLCRWRGRDAWHDFLERREEELLRRELGGRHDLLVFLVRAAAVEWGSAEFIMDRLKTKFSLLDTVELDSRSQRRVMRKARGGDWLVHKGFSTIPPVIAAVCYDHAPTAVGGSSKRVAKYAHVRNHNVFYKHELRDLLAEKCPAQAADFLHSSDNDIESMAYLKAIYEGVDFGTNWPAWASPPANDLVSQK